MKSNYFNLTIFKKWIAPFFITVSTIIATDLIYETYKQYENQLEIDSSKVKLAFESEIKKFEYGLEGDRGIFVVSNFTPTRDHFKNYAESRNYFKNFKGSLGFGFIRNVKENDLKQFIQKNKNWFRIHPQILISEHFIIEYIEPISQNKNALGLNIAFDNSRKNAAIKAAKTGLAVLTVPIKLVQREKEHTGFLYLLPVYRTIYTPLTEKERMANLVGWAYTPIVLEDLLNSILPKISQDLKLKINFSTSNELRQVRNINSLFTSMFNRLVLVSAGESIWRVNISKSPKLFLRNLYFITFTYILINILLYLLSRYLIRYIDNYNRSFSDKKFWLKAVIEGAGYSVIATRPDGVIQTFNNTAEKMLGYSSSELIGTATPAIFHDAKEVEKMAQKISEEFGTLIEPGFEVLIFNAKRGLSDVNDWTYIKKDGESIQIRLCVTAIYNDTNELIGFLGIAEDLTEYNKMKSLIEEQNTKIIASSKMSMLGEMASGIAHEINNPLTVIIGKSQQLIASNNLDESSNLKLLKIIETGKRIDRIIKSLKLFSRDSSHEQDVPLKLSSVLDLTLELCLEKIKFEGITLIEEIDVDARIMGNPTQISQVLMNIIGNSIDAISFNEERWIKINITIVNNNAIIKITDSGKGIPKDVLEKIMIPFFTTKELGKGTGLGLSISKGIIEKHGGRIYYDMNSNNTCFVIEIPCIS